VNKLLIILVSLLSLLYADTTSFQDPYKKIDYFVLENGMQVYLLSNKKATNTNISMKVNVGWDIEDKDNYGLSHLVEHMVFRDKRIPHRDYLDYLKDKGASYVNGFTSRYDTKFVTKIDSNKSYWVAETFAKMFFDKDVDAEDIEIEKGAVQVEIGEKVWYDYMGSKLVNIKVLFPPKKSIYESQFGVKKEKDLPSSYVEKVNNKHFTFQEVMAHYKKYYYPSNMILKITGNFNQETMKQLVIAKYGKIHIEGTDRTHKPPRDATLSHKPYIYYREGLGKNYGYVGVQYVFDDCQKHIILNAFMTYVAQKIQQDLRNRDGKSYTVSSSSRQSRGAGIVSVSFDGLHDNFDKNIALVKKTIQHYVKDINNTMIEDALEEYKKRYTSIEFDSDSLNMLVNKAEHMRSDHKIVDKTHYEFFKSITPEKFKQVIASVFVPENNYVTIYRDYYVFPSDYALINIFILFVIIVLYLRFSHLIFRKRGIDYKKREILFFERVANRFAGFIVFVFIVLLSGIIYAWAEYFVMTYIMGDINYAYTLDIPYGLGIEMLDNILSTILMFAILRWGVTYHSRLDVTKDKIYILGSKPFIIDRDDIVNIEVVPWHINKFFHIVGFAFFFWRPLLKITTKTDTYNIRSSHAHAVKDNLTLRWLQKS